MNKSKNSAKIPFPFFKWESQIPDLLLVSVDHWLPLTFKCCPWRCSRCGWVDGWGHGKYSWWQPQIRSTHQLRLVVYPMISRVLAPSQVVQYFFNQQYHGRAFCCSDFAFNISSTRFWNRSAAFVGSTSSCHVVMLSGERFASKPQGWNSFYLQYHRIDIIWCSWWILRSLKDPPSNWWSKSDCTKILRILVMSKIANSQTLTILRTNWCNPQHSEWNKVIQGCLEFQFPFFLIWFATNGSLWRCEVRPSSDRRTSWGRLGWVDIRSHGCRCFHFLR